MFDDLFEWADKNQRHWIDCTIAMVKDTPNRNPAYTWPRGYGGDYSACGEVALMPHNGDLRGTAVMTFPDRKDGDTDKWEIVVSRDGSITVTLLDWSTRQFRLEKVQRADHEGGNFALGYLDEVGVGLVTMSFDRGADVVIR